MNLHIGLDDTDSNEGGCTTHIASLLVEKLTSLGAKFQDYPNLIRLNPNTPWKTRGNASICLRINIDEKYFSRIVLLTKELIEKHARFMCENTNPGVVFHIGKIPDEVKIFSETVVQKIVDLKQTDFLIKRYCMKPLCYKNRRGLIGATAAIGGTLERDHTYEIIAYRNPKFWGKKRQIDKESIKEMNASLIDTTFSNIDEKGKTLITPNGPDPVLYGIRGETAETVNQAQKIIRSFEPIDRWLIYRTNQGTDAHFNRQINISQVVEYNPAIIQGIVLESPKTILGGHVFVNIGDKTGNILCAFFEPTGNLRHKVWKLIKGDEIRLSGGIKKANDFFTINVEKLEIINLQEKHLIRNPKCPRCKGSTESIGLGKGFRCKKCKFKDQKGKKEKIVKKRDIKIGLYLPDLSAHRHLTKPIKRYGKEKEYQKDKLIKQWYYFNQKASA